MKLSPSPSGTTPRRASFEHRAVIIAVLAASLTLTGVIGGGLLLAGGHDYSQPTDANPNIYDTPSPDWSKGAEQSWTTTITAGSQVITVPGYLLSLSGDDPAASTLTAFRLSESGIKESWSTVIDTSADVGGADGTDNFANRPAYLLWGEHTLIHDTTLYDLSTGDSTTAQWSSGDATLVADDVAIACNTRDICTAYRESDPDTELWSSRVDDMATAVKTVSLKSFNRPVYVRNGQRYCQVTHRDILNIDTGERVSLNIPLPDEKIGGYSVMVASDGWILTLVTNDSKWTQYAYDVEGGDPADEYESNALQTQEFIVYANTPPSRADYKAQYSEDSRANILGVLTQNSDGCGESLAITGGRTITLPVLNDDLSCTYMARASADGTTLIIVVSPSTARDDQTFRFMYQVATGDTVAFPGMDAESGAVFDLVADDYVVGYDPSSGTLNGYRPAS